MTDDGEKIAATPPVGVILAGGQSRRMGGGDKGLLPFAGATMLAAVLARLGDTATPIALNANGDPSRFEAFDLPVVADAVEGFAGPLAGVHAGLSWARSHVPAATHIVTAPGDAPFLPLDFVSRLQGVADGETKAIVLAESLGRTHPVAGLWPVALTDDLEAALRDGVRKVLAWTDRHDCRIASFSSILVAETEVDPFFNANTPEELAEAEVLAEALRVLGAGS